MATQKNGKVALVTGANRGIGLEISHALAAKGCTVVMGCRDKKKGDEQAALIKTKGGDVDVVALDTGNVESIRNAVKTVLVKHKRIDILVNNAGVFLDPHEAPAALQANVNTLINTFQVNTVGPFALMQLVVPHMIERGSGRVVNLSSGMGQLTNMNGGYPGYRVSKTALNALTCIFADEAKKSPNVLINSMCPGWVKTDMGGPNANRSLEQGADTAVWLATDEQMRESGRFFRDRNIIAW